MGDTGTTTSFVERFRAVVERLPLSGHHVVVAFSGGLDSTLLLHGLVRYAGNLSLSAIHFDHGLNAASADWSAHCAAVAESLNIELTICRLNLEPVKGQSLEAVAREARYGELADRIGPNDVVVTAHHADDQLETVLMRLLRGSGVRGLTAIHAVAALGKGLLVRPLLEFTRAEIEAEALAMGLQWVEDPSNADLRFDRNFVRATVLPALRERWPRAGLTAARLARQMADAETVLGEVATADLAAVSERDRISLDRLALLSEPRIDNALRHAVRSRNLPVPNAVQLGELKKAFGARDDAEVVVSWPGAEARIYRRQLFVLPPKSAEPATGGRIDTGSAFVTSDGELRLVDASDYGIPDRWARAGLAVAFRVGGERFRPHGSRHEKSLKQWFQETGIVPWMRDRVPLLYHDDALVAVGDICLAAGLPQARADGPFWRPVWSGHAEFR
jgi:tRNA(Ile)-lysidine synthase